ncbi:putative phospholipase B-like 2 [Amphibalanus amphitrite]|uniref:Phospholipase B-like n=1 Tax=Amphibalanus amphitrite TaxID=1232801 RepID=A0A6A4WN98_AMPAM|nr:putative phospholipase B-like 2 [Amphibalanus amphitrite]
MHHTTFPNPGFYFSWDFLEVGTNGDYPDNDQAYAAGLVEAYLTKDFIVMHWNNTVSGYCQRLGKEMCDRLTSHVDANERWVMSMVEQNGASDPYWHQVGLVYQQVYGIVDYVEVTPNYEDDPGVKWLSLWGDLEDLEIALEDHEKRPKHVKASLGSRVLGSGHCSALVKVLPGAEDLYTSHVTWTSFQTMLRIQKRYILNYGQTEGADKVAIPGRIATFSSYPGIIASHDDFAVLSSGLVSQETTIGNNNNDLWQYVQPEGQVMEWVRVLVANNLATSGEEWTDVFGRHNSGTYNNHYDMTPRARIFRRDQDGVTDVGSMMKLMRYNDYKNDPLSACDCEPPYSAENAISARCDLNPANGTYPFSALSHRLHGATDMKLTTTKLWSLLEAADNLLHWGHPDVFQFGPIQWNFQWQ